MTKDLDLDSLRTRFSLDSLYDKNDLASLALAVIEIVERRLYPAVCRVFFLSPPSRDYREVTHEGLFTVPEDSLFVSFLAMKASPVAMSDLGDEVIFQKDDMLKTAFAKTLGVDQIVPVVRAGRLLCFLAVSAGGRPLEERSRVFFKQLSEVLSSVAHSAIAVDERMRELVKFIDFSESLRDLRSYDNLVSGLLPCLRKAIPFDRGAFYEYDEFARVLVTRATFEVGELAEIIPLDRCVSGWVFEKRRPASAPDIRTHPYFSTLDAEPYIDGPFVSAPVVSSKRAIGVITLAGGSGSGSELSLEYLHLLRIACSLVGNELENRSLYQKLEEGYFQTIRAVASALESKDGAARGHSERVMGYAEGIARELGLSDEKTSAIRFAAILHDIGKAGISDDLIGKPGGLTPQEFAQMKGHTDIGSGILESSGLFENFRDYVKYHHEKLDGSGYYGKKKGEYPWESTIISIADMFDALTSERPYRTALPPQIVMKSLAEAVDIAFDRRVYDAFATYLAKLGVLKGPTKS